MKKMGFKERFKTLKLDLRLVYKNNLKTDLGDMSLGCICMQADLVNNYAKN